MSTINDRAARVFLALCVGFGGIVAMLTWWQIFEAESLRTRDSNNQTAYYEQRIKRGLILTEDGVVLARNRPEATRNGDTIFHRRYPQSAFAAHVVGYNTIGRSRTGIERSQNDHLTGSTRSLGSLLGKLDGEDVVVGDNVRLTLNAKAQRIAERALGPRRGSVVAIEPKTGRVLVMASSPAYDLNAAEERFDTISQAGGSPLINRATQGRYAPGSTFKLVTAAAALEQGVASKEQTFPGGCSYEPELAKNFPISNFGGSCVGSHDFTYALTNSVNTTFARLGDRLGGDGLREQMARFGFGDSPLVDDLPASEQRASGLYEDGEPLDEGEGVDPARVAIGQERLEVTPLQMALVVATIANGGQGMRPYLVEQVRSAGGRVLGRGRPDPLDERAMEAANARALTDMMKSVVDSGTGRAAALDGVQVAGKTGTADTGSGNQVWFVGFAPADNPKVAVAVTIEGQAEGTFGGSAAAPIAHDVLEALL